jgi:2-dehydro-3-deoxyphosphogluconate aldolase / (4S)-4-hydroxy-2-oxoglutarate aldolase
VTIDEVMALAPVIPVLVIDDVTHARPLAEALVDGGLRALEVTLRTECALDVIAEMAKVEGAVVGAGTVLDEAQIDAAVAAGARFLVSPGFTDRLGRAVIERSVPFLPGVATASDIMRGLDLGFTRFKFFPAEASGGVAALKALSAPFGGIRFCPTGGIGPENAASYLALPSVACVGGSWVAPPSDGDWAAVTARARAAAAFKA